MAWQKSAGGAYLHGMRVGDPARVISTEEWYVRGIGLTLTVWREADGVKRVYLSPEFDTPSSASSSIDESHHKLRHYLSNDNFVTNRDGNVWVYSEANVQTGKPVAVAWDDAAGKSVTAWVHQSRTNDALDHGVRVALGAINEEVLTDPFTGLPRSSVAPAVACKAGAAVGGHNCLLAYVPMHDRPCTTDTDCGLPEGMIPCNTSSNPPRCERTGNVEVIAFTASLSGNTTVVSSDWISRPLANAVRTAGRIAAWYHNGKFWIAMRDTNTNQRLTIFSSTDGAAWSFFTSGSIDLAVGPTAVSILNDAGSQNLLMYVR